MNDRYRIIQGDCLQIIPTLTGIDAVVTDPPYGVNLGNTNRNTSGHGLVRGSYSSYDDSYEAFVSTVVPRLSAAIGMSARAAVFTGPHIPEQKKPDAIGGVYCPSAVGRHCWGFKDFLPVLFYGKALDLNKGSKPTVLRSTARAEKNGHPCPKPLDWMIWLVERTTRPGDTVLDPFMGSGTTGVACMKTGRKFIGIELDAKYCEIARRRMDEACPLFAGGSN